MLPHCRGGCTQKRVVSRRLIGTYSAAPATRYEPLWPGAGRQGCFVILRESKASAETGSRQQVLPSGQDRIAINLFTLRLAPRYRSRVGILKKRSLWISASAALAAAAALAGCGSTTYFDGRMLPPSGLINRVMIAVQNPGALSKGALDIVDAYYDERSGYNGSPASFSISGYGSSLPISIQNMPEEQYGAVYGAGDGTFTLVSYASERTTGTVSGLNGLSSSIFITRNQSYVFAASHASHVLTVVNQAKGGSYALGLPGVYRVSVNPGGPWRWPSSQNSNYAYYPLQLTAAQSLAYSGGPVTWPKAAVDCEPQNATGLVPLSDAEPRSRSDATGILLWRPADLRPSGQGRLLVRWQHRLYPQLRTRVRRNHIVRLSGPDSADDLSSRPAIRPAALQSRTVRPAPTPTQRHGEYPHPRRRQQRPGRFLHHVRCGPAAAARAGANALWRQSYRRQSQHEYGLQPGLHQRWTARRHQPHDRGRRQHAVDRHDRLHRRACATRPMRPAATAA